jgi:3-deoxy-D-manno-octulosonate 8-phosphate phosphatase (KDO 8-P phosphatase)
MALPAHQVELRSRRLKLLLLDVDGVLTDGTVLIGPESGEVKAFSIRDGAAMVWAQRSGLPIGLLTGRPSEATNRRAYELGVEIVVNSGPDKREAFDQILRERRITNLEVAYMGDDLLDLPVLRRAGLSAAPVDAADEVKAAVHFVSKLGGGRGAVREFIEVLLKGRGSWDALIRALTT